MTGGEREVVKLSLGEGQPVLNVLPVGLEGEKMTLVCPFPVLPVEVPVRVTLPGREDLGPVNATIRRVSVELMGEAGLPRFKLQLVLEKGAGAGLSSLEGDVAASDGALALVVEEVVTEGTSAASEQAPAVDEVDEVDEEASVIVASELMDEGNLGDEPLASVREPVRITAADVSWSAGDLFGLDGARGDESDLVWPEEALAEAATVDLDGDPSWTGGPDLSHLPSPAELRRRSSRWPVRMAVTLALIVSVLAVGYVMRHQIVAAVGPFIGEELDLSSLGLPGFEAQAANPLAGLAQRGEQSPLPAGQGIVEEASVESEALAGEATAELMGDGRVEDVEATLEPEDATLDPAGAPTAEVSRGEGAAALAVEPASAQADDPSVEEDEESLRVVLPTRWPVTEARSYRLHDPTGIVIDVPGGMAAERARWIDTAHERVRSVRVLERETGVRFIIYLNDEQVPRYRVGYSRSGILVDILGPDQRHLSTK